MKKTTKLLGIASLLFATSFNVNAQCYTPTESGTNIIFNPSFQGDFDASGFTKGWTNFDPYTTVNSCDDVSDTSGSLYLKGNCYPNGGVIEYVAPVQILPGHNYQIKAMIKNETAADDAFNFHLPGDVWDLPDTNNHSSSAHLVGIPSTTGWVQFDKTVTTGLNASGDLKFLIMSCDGFVDSTIDDFIYIDNLEIYDLGENLEPVMIVSETKLVFSETPDETATFTISSSNLSGDITLTAPTGITLDKTTITIAEAAEGDVTVTATFDGLANILNENITISTSGIDPKMISVIGSVDSGCFTPLNSASNMISDSKLLSRGSFGGWGDVTIAYEVAGACGATTALLSTDGVNVGYPDGAALDASGIAWLPNTQYRARAWVKTIEGGIAIKLGQVDGGTFDGEFVDALDIDTNGEWVLMDKTFTTGAAPGTGGFFSFNTADATGTVATQTYVDNFELYDISTLSSEEVAFNSSSVKISPNPVNDVLNIITGDKISKVTIYDVLGRVILSKDNQSSIDVSSLSSGSYIVNIVVGGTSQSLKFLK
ncbi:T9SS type A sorting domain-containing protein [Wenyingzhuangia marina]|uniref:Por secretion system C-terminal sorting domain-containing protein n=1 Tax=Wenyingzhuangia marina TaxID=1195760 RepID=A0A1M5VXW5_9FLAO|nr:T9SS type A sorting domain-containing protein [Wenyingzhuangia marina]GGF77183.1 hypothetical protein GCM10011397_20240 [Wenyingzhuangia marina]SHH80020.1 Por secretion system C-terminal sorting domain-containing protein [Wenyingzhuangia marina]